MNISEGGTRRWRSQGIGNVTRSKEYRKERSAEDIIGSVLGTLRVKCLCYFNIQVSRKRPISLEFKKPFFIRVLRMIGRRLLIISPGNRHKMSKSGENPIYEDGGNHEPG